LSYMGIEVYH